MIYQTNPVSVNSLQFLSVGPCLLENWLLIWKTPLGPLKLITVLARALSTPAAWRLWCDIAIQVQSNPHPGIRTVAQRNSLLVRPSEGPHKGILRKSDPVVVAHLNSLLFKSSWSCAMGIFTVYLLKSRRSVAQRNSLLVRSKWGRSKVVLYYSNPVEVAQKKS